jgi:hypothetical protein
MDSEGVSRSWRVHAREMGIAIEVRGGVRGRWFGDLQGKGVISEDGVLGSDEALCVCDCLRARSEHAHVTDGLNECSARGGLEANGWPEGLARGGCPAVRGERQKYPLGVGLGNGLESAGADGLGIYVRELRRSSSGVERMVGGERRPAGSSP